MQFAVDFVLRAGEPPMFFAARSNDTEAMKLLLLSGATVGGFLEPWCVTLPGPSEARESILSIRLLHLRY